jgi:hypothetical protein
MNKTKRAQRFPNVVCKEWPASFGGYLCHKKIKNFDVGALTREWAPRFCPSLRRKGLLVLMQHGIQVSPVEGKQKTYV